MKTWKVTHRSIASLQSVTTPEGDQIDVIYMNPEHITVCNAYSDEDDAAYAALPWNVRSELEARFQTVFDLPTADRADTVTMYREQPATITTKE